MTFAGSRDRVESRLVPEAGYELDTFAVSGIPRSPGRGTPRALWCSLTAPVACLRILSRRRPDVVLGAGGYVAGPMVLAAWLRRIPAALTEADAHVGLANRLAAPFARRVFLAYEIEGRSGAKYRVVGRPIPSAHTEQLENRDGSGSVFPPTGRSSRSSALSQAQGRSNELAVSTWGASGPAVLHICGERDHHLLRSGVLRADYVLLPETDHFGEALAAADLAVSRAGGTVWELAAAGTPAVLVPYPHATADHQMLNARHFEQGGGAVLVPDSEIDRVPRLAEQLLGDPDRLARMREAMLALARPHAAQEIAEELIRIAGS